MCNFSFFIFMCASAFIFNANAKVVSFIDPCHWNDSECIMKSAKKAIPFVVKGNSELGLPTLDPLMLKNVNGDNGELKMSFENLVIERLPECNLIKVERPEKLKLDVELECPITVKGQYTIGGKMFVLPIEGHGDCEIKTEKIKLSCSIILKEFEKGGKVYYKFASFNFKYEPEEKVFFKLDNLYGGDKQKAEPIQKILDESWREVISDLAKPVITEVIQGVVHGFGKLFASIPIDEIELQ